MRHLRRALLSGAAAATFGLGLCTTADAWGPTSRSALVSAAAHVLGQDPAFTLSKFQRYVAQGSDLSQEEFDAAFPLYKVDPVGAIQREMLLLQSLRGNRIDPYYAYRLGAVGRMVADTTAPMANSPGPIRARYYADVDKSIGRASFQLAARKVVDPRTYFNFVQALASANDHTFELEYQAGDGFNGLARSSLPADASRSVNSVADVWYTVLTSRATAFSQPVESKRQYVLGAISFYIKQGNLTEAEASYTLAKDQSILDKETQKLAADLFFDSKHYERAMVEYQKVLLLDPGRRDVVERVAKYYEITGDDALEKGKLEVAREAYQESLNADSLHPDAQRKLLDVEAKIYARDERLTAQRAALEEAHGFENRAEEAAARRDYAMAIGFLRNASERYASVTGEFPAESKDAASGRLAVDMRSKELNQELIHNSMSLSGTNAAFDARQMAAQTPDLSQQALKGMLQTEYQEAVRALGETSDEPKP